MYDYVQQSFAIFNINPAPWMEEGTIDTRIKKVVIEDGVTSIGNDAFQLCQGLTEITIPASVTSVGSGAFCFAYELADVYYGGTEEQWNEINIGTENNPLLSANIHFTGSEEENVTYSLFKFGTKNCYSTIFGQA